MPNDDHPSKEFIILVLAVAALGVLFTLLFTVNVWKPVYSVQPKVAEKLMAPPIIVKTIPGKVFPVVIHAAVKKIAHTCDPAKDYGCGAWLKRNGKWEKM